MAVVMIGGMLSSTLLTLFFVPALYAAWFGLRREVESPEDGVAGALAMEAS